LILGTFRNSCLNRLKLIRNALIDYGLTNSRISLDFDFPVQAEHERPEIYNLRASEYWLQRSDVQLFIFFKGPDNASIGIELATHLYNPRNSWSTIVGVYEDCPSLVAGLALRFEPSLTLFSHSNDDEIISQSEGQILSRLSQYYGMTRERQVGQREIHSQIK
jgi:hypothetical protein